MAGSDSKGKGKATEPDGGSEMPPTGDASNSDVAENNTHANATLGSVETSKPKKLASLKDSVNSSSDTSLDQASSSKPKMKFKPVANPVKMKQEKEIEEAPPYPIRKTRDYKDRQPMENRPPRKDRPRMEDLMVPAGPFALGPAQQGSSRGGGGGGGGGG
ncbi:hypothetical protein HDU67_004528, partial [Dinochytrium kinnereticum]